MREPSPLRACHGPLGRRLRAGLQSAQLCEQRFTQLLFGDEPIAERRSTRPAHLDALIGKIVRKKVDQAVALGRREFELHYCSLPPTGGSSFSTSITIAQRRRKAAGARMESFGRRGRGRSSS